MFSALVGHPYQTPTLRRLHGIGKGNVHPRTGHLGQQGEQMYSSTPPSTSALMGVDGQRHAPAALHPGKSRYPLYRRLGGPHGRSGRVQKISPPLGFDPQTVQSVASRYTDWAIPTPWTEDIELVSSKRNVKLQKTERKLTELHSAPSSDLWTEWKAHQNASATRSQGRHRRKLVVNFYKNN